MDIALGVGLGAVTGYGMNEGWCYGTRSALDWAVNKDTKDREATVELGSLFAALVSHVPFTLLMPLFTACLSPEKAEFNSAFMITAMTANMVNAFVNIRRASNRWKDMKVSTPDRKIWVSRWKVVRISLGGILFVAACALGGAFNGYALAPVPVAISGIVLGGAFGTAVAVVGVATFLLTTIFIWHSFGLQIAIGTPPESGIGVKKA